MLRDDEYPPTVSWGWALKNGFFSGLILNSSTLVYECVFPLLDTFWPVLETHR